MMHLKCLTVVSHLSAFTRLLLLLALIAFLLVVATLMEHALRTMAASEVEAIAYKQVLVVLAEEQTLEYEYVLHPSPALRDEQRVKATTFSRLVQNLQQDADTGDDVFGDHLLTQQAAYISSIHRSFAAADAGDVTRANSIRNTSVTPLFRQIEQELIRQSNIQEALSAQNVVFDIHQIDHLAVTKETNRAKLVSFASDKGDHPCFFAIWLWMPVEWADASAHSTGIQREFFIGVLGGVVSS